MDRHHDNPTNNEEIMLKFYKRFLILRTLPVPVIAAINGPAIGAGLSLAVGGADMRVASPKASMGFTFTRLGLHPGMAGNLVFQIFYIENPNKIFSLASCTKTRWSRECR